MGKWESIHQDGQQTPHPCVSSVSNNRVKIEHHLLHLDRVLITTFETLRKKVVNLRLYSGKMPILFLTLNVALQLLLLHVSVRQAVSP